MSISTNRRPFVSLPVVMMAGAALLLALLVPGWSAGRLRGETPPAFLSRAVLTSTDAFLVGKPEIQVTAQTQSINLNPRGRYALITRDEAGSGHSSIALYDSLLSRTRAVWEARTMEGSIAQETRQALWFPQTDAFMLVVVTLSLQPLPEGKVPTEKTDFVYYDAARGSVSRRTALSLQTLESSEESPDDAAAPNGMIDTTVSPTQPYLVVAQTNEKQTNFHIIDGRGRVTRTMSFPQSVALWG